MDQIRPAVRRCLSRAVVVGLVAMTLFAGATIGADAATKPVLRFGVTTPGGPVATSEINAISQLAGEKPTVEMWYEDFAQPFPAAKVAAAVSRGATPVITWEPWLWGGGVDQPNYSLDRITAGAFDSYLWQWAQALRNSGRSVVLRFGHEMNGNWYPWNEGVNGNGPGDFVAAWRHVHDVFSAAGATKASWMWSPNVPYDGSVPLTGLYPGSGYVNAVALDGYNWGTSQSWSSWTPPQDLFGPGLSQLRAIASGKPIWIAETASIEQGGSKPDWITALVPYLAGQSGVVGFIWFQHNKEADWRFDSTPASAQAMSQALTLRR